MFIMHDWFTLLMPEACSLLEMMVHNAWLATAHIKQGVQVPPVSPHLVAELLFPDALRLPFSQLLLQDGCTTLLLPAALNITGLHTAAQKGCPTKGQHRGIRRCAGSCCAVAWQQKPMAWTNRKLRMSVVLESTRTARIWRGSMIAHRSHLICLQGSQPLNLHHEVQPLLLLLLSQQGCLLLLQTSAQHSIAM